MLVQQGTKQYLKGTLTPSDILKIKKNKKPARYQNEAIQHIQNIDVNKRYGAV